MKSVKTREIINNIYTINDKFVSCYFIKTGLGFVAIDSGSNAANVATEIRKLNIDPTTIEAVFLTHTDADHTGGLVLFPNAKVYISDKEEQMINGKTRRALLFKNSLRTTGYHLLADNQSIEVSGTKIKGILTPGHTPGSMSYIVNDVYIFTGDTLTLQNGNVGVFNRLINMNTKSQKDSITKISRLTDLKYIFTAHSGYTDNFKEAFTRWNVHNNRL